MPTIPPTPGSTLVRGPDVDSQSVLCQPGNRQDRSAWAEEVAASLAMAFVFLLFRPECRLWNKCRVGHIDTLF